MKAETATTTFAALLMTAGSVQTQADSGSEAAHVALPLIEIAAETETQGRTIPIEQVQRNLASDMADLFKGDTSVSVGGGARNAQRLYLRGIEGGNLNITIDGARQGRSLHQHRGGIGGIDPSLLKQAEIITGPSAERGPGALGGAIRFETVDAQDLLDPGRRSGATLKAGYASADRSEQGGITVYGLANDHLGLLAHLSAINREDYRIGGGDEAPNTAGQDRNYFVKASLLDLQGHSLRLSAERNTNSGLYLWGSTGSDFGYPPEGAVPQYQVAARESFSLEHRYHQGNPLIDWRLNLYSNDNSLEATTFDTSVANEVTSEEFGLSLRNVSRFRLGPTEHRLTLGGDYYSEEGGSLSSSGGAQDFTSSNLGLFVQERMDFRWLTLSLGARFDDYSADYGLETLEGDAISPNASAELRLPRGFTAFAGYGEAVRGSGIIPISWLPLATEIRAADAEESTQREAGLRYRADGLLRPGDRFNAELTLFNTELDQVIQRVGGGGPPHKVGLIIDNTPGLTSEGFEVRASWSWEQFQTRLSFTSVDTTDRDGNPVGIIRRLGASSGDRLVWDNRWTPREGLSLGYTLTAVADLDEVPAGEPERPGYTLHDIQAEWRPRDMRNLTLSLAVHNLFDERYADQASLISTSTGVVEEPGRDIRLAISYRF